ncbi:MAG: CinA family protein [Woeseiaceae bacterium]
MKNNILPLVDALAEKLIAKHQRLSVAESCTGGGIAHSLTEKAGSSQWFECGFVTYSNQSKQDMLGVNASTLKQYGAVSENTAVEMAEGALVHSQSDVSCSVTGIAGPDGGSDEKPVGLVWFAWSIGTAGSNEPQTQSEKMIFKGGRAAVREQAVEHALQGILKILK